MASVFISMDTVWPDEDSDTEDDSKKETDTVEMKRGVPEASPLSPILFNLVLDTLAARLIANNSDDAILPSTLFADTVILQAEDAANMQNMLDITTKWTDDYDMKCVPSKCRILAGHEIAPPLKLAGEDLKVTIAAVH